MFERIKEFIIDFIVTAVVVAIAWTTFGVVVMLAAKPLVDLSFTQSLSAVVLAFIFFAIGKINFNVDDSEDYE